MISIVLSALVSAVSPISVTVFADSGRIPISPFIYGKNNDLDSAALRIYNEAGLRLLRANGGNNATKYNWRKGLSSHPDWYNNVYRNDWDGAARTIQTKLPGTQGMFAFQLLGWTADDTTRNFGDWAFNQSQWWGSAGPNQNLAGGGTVDMAGGGKAAKDGDANKYLTEWPADSTAGIVDHWFGNGGIGLDSSRFRYWNMDNEPDGWSGTHDDVVPALTGHKLTAEDFVQRWAAVAKAVRRKFPGARLVGPASMSEWQWYTWENEGVNYKGTDMCFPEYLIRRLAEIQDSTGVRMLDVYDVHLYLNLPSNVRQAEVLQAHRFLYDTTYVNPRANGVKTVTGGWDESIKREFFFLRVRRWLDRYFGPGHGIGVGSTESSIDSSVSNHAAATSVFQASMLGTMADNGTELFTPWFWYAGMWESLHLFSRHAFATRVASRSALDTVVSAYSSIAAAGDSLAVILVNRDPSATRSVSVALSGFVPAGTATTLQLAGATKETFRSHENNALRKGSVAVSSGSLALELPAMSVTAVKMAGAGRPVSVLANGSRPPVPSGAFGRKGQYLSVMGSVGGRFELVGADGRTIRSVPIANGAGILSTAGLPNGLYFARWAGGAAKVVLAE